MLALAFSGFHSLVSYSLPMFTLPSSTAWAPFLKSAAFGSVTAPFIMTMSPDLALAPRAWRRALPCTLADFLVVEGHVGVDRALGEAVVGDDRDAGFLAFLTEAAMALESTASTMSASTLLVIIVSACWFWVVASCLAFA